MAYFTAMLAAAGPRASSPPREWQVVDVDLDGLDDLDSLADALRDAGEGVEGSNGSDGASLVIAVLEREDEWFALARPGADGVRLFVSDLEAASASRYAELLADAAAPPDAGGSPGDGDGDGGADGGDAGEDDGEDEVEDGGGDSGGDDPDGVRGAVVAGPSWAGDAEILVDVGVGADELVDASESHDPATALTVVGERVGFVDLLEALR